MARLQVSVADLGMVGGPPDASPMTPTKVLGKTSPWGASDDSSFVYPDCRAMGPRSLHQVADSDTDAPNSSASRRSTPFSERATSAALLSTAGSSGASADDSDGGGAEMGWAALEGEPAHIGGAPFLLPMTSPVGQQPMGLPLWGSHGRTSYDTLGSLDVDEAESAPRSVAVPTSPSHKGPGGGRAGNKGKAPDSPAVEDKLKNVPQDRFHAQFRKTQLCRYIGTGCLRGEDCFYAHSKQELRVPPNLCKTSLCKAWQQGKCPRSAAECQFAHGPRDLRVSEGFQSRTSPGSENDQDPAFDAPPPSPASRKRQHHGGKYAKEKPAPPAKPAPATAAARQGAASPAPGSVQQELLNLASFLPPPPPAPLQPEPVLPLAPGLGLLGPGFPSELPDVSTFALLNAMAAIPLAAWSLARHEEASKLGGVTDTQTPFKDVPARDVRKAPSEAASTADQGGPGTPSSSNKNRERFLSQFRKTQFCRYVKSGCLRGSQCPFAHSMEEMSPPPDLAKTSLCKLWEQGRCPLEATQCQFAHGTRELRVTSAYSRGGICKMFQLGKCNKGKDCPHQHWMPELTDKEKEGPQPAARQAQPKEKDAASPPAALQMEPRKIPASTLARLGSWTGPSVDSNPVTVGNVVSKALDEDLSSLRLA